MANFNLSPNMNLPIPTIGVDPGPDWASNINASLTILDAHNHDISSGVQITPAGLNINSDLTFGVNNATMVRSVRFFPNLIPLSPITNPLDIGCIYESGVDLWYNDGNGNEIQLTSHGGINFVPTSIPGLVPPASLTYVAGDETFVFQSGVNTPANLDAGSVTVRNITASSNGITISPPVALATNYTITLPALPAQTNVVTLGPSGTLASITYDQVGQNMTVVGADAIGVSMDATGADAIAASRTRAAGSVIEGIGGVASSLSSGSYATTSTGFANVPNLTVTLSTSGRPVFLGLMSDGGGSYAGISVEGTNNTGAFLVFERNASTVGRYLLDYASVNTSGSTAVLAVIPASSVSFIDGLEIPLPAGTYTYTVAAAINGAFPTTSFGISNLILIAYEL
jgi:hypothetical protein